MTSLTGAGNSGLLKMVLTTQAVSPQCLCPPVNRCQVVLRQRPRASAWLFTVWQPLDANVVLISPILCAWAVRFSCSTAALIAAARTPTVELIVKGFGPLRDDRRLSGS